MKVERIKNSHSPLTRKQFVYWTKRFLQCLKYESLLKPKKKRTIFIVDIDVHIMSTLSDRGNQAREQKKTINGIK